MADRIQVRCVPHELHPPHLVGDIPTHGVEEHPRDDPQGVDETHLGGGPPEGEDIEAEEGVDDARGEAPEDPADHQNPYVPGEEPERGPPLLVRDQVHGRLYSVRFKTYGS